MRPTMVDGSGSQVAVVVRVTAGQRCVEAEMRMFGQEGQVSIKNKSRRRAFDRARANAFQAFVG